jgi:CelD/BcsL family acetyltransferase involved in cellulose biosynthesis
LQIISTVSDLERILPDLERLSAQTYQSRLLGLGFKRDSATARRLFLGVENGIGRVYVLRAGGDPISFQIGYCYRNTFYATQTGYDPARADLQPGIVVLALTLESVAACNDHQVRYFDFMYGESLYKKRLSNTFHDESQLYLIPRTARGTSVWLALQAIHFISRAMAKLLEKANMRGTVAKLLRRSA